MTGQVVDIAEAYPGFRQKTRAISILFLLADPLDFKSRAGAVLVRQSLDFHGQTKLIYFRRSKRR